MLTFPQPQVRVTFTSLGSRCHYYHFMEAEVDA